MLRKSGAAFCLLQETHGIEATNHLWRREWGGEAFFCNGSQSSRGVAILVNRKFSNIKPKVSSDNNGHIILMEVDIDEIAYTIGSLYAPTQDKPGEQVLVLETLEELLEKSNVSNPIIAGDFNSFIDPILDRNNQSSNSSHSDVVRDKIRLFLEDWGLCDLWRIRKSLSISIESYKDSNYKWMKGDWITLSRLIPSKENFGNSKKVKPEN